MNQQKLLLSQNKITLNSIYSQEVPNSVPNSYNIVKDHSPCPLLTIQFQQGTRGQQGSIDGVWEEELLEIVKNRLQRIRGQGKSSEDISKAIDKIEDAIMYLTKIKLEELEK